ncbi:class I SAM-dependent methyltransferase [Micrococcus porci]|uniref:class I SAM-dependent methyltransferase n=1 Tax=Micrococcus porci TaxID=2856555 RepID=UPI001CCFFE22|nr:class I SAM-dependent methyltransferase [Micrococcus porci]UBH25836.1 class I SAM-dependent methyltransferase [Micrococcus porci]
MAAVADDDRLLVEAWAHETGGSLADVGCGPAHWTAHLAALGHDIVGVEPVDEFVAHARRVHPGVRVETGSFRTLPASTFDGILAWYSMIHTPPPEATLLLEHAHEALRPGGSLLLGFFAGDRVEPFDHAVTTAWYWPLDDLTSVLTAAGFTVTDRGTRLDPGTRRHGWMRAHRN